VQTTGSNLFTTSSTTAPKTNNNSQGAKKSSGIAPLTNPAVLLIINGKMMTLRENGEYV
jgi:hypothetical protein